jgi:hypothetical protein
VFSSKNAHADSVWPVSHHQPASEAAYNRDAYVGQQGAFLKGRRPDPGLEDRRSDGHDRCMSPFLIVALAIIAFAAGFHLHWALGGRLGLSVSLPQRADGDTVMPGRIGWWRPAAAGVAVALVLLGALAAAVDNRFALPLPINAARAVLIAAGVAFMLRAVVPTQWTGFFKKIRSTRWARFDSWLYCPLFLLLGAALIAVALG